MMARLSLAEIGRESQGSLSGDAYFDSVSTDTRTIKQGDLFVALSGDNFDGNQFVAEAFEKGASAAIVSRPIDSALPHLLVDDTQMAYGIIARENRRKFSGKLIALTGSSGKTTCKEMIAAILSQSGKVQATSKNLNNEIGVPLTLLGVDASHNFAVIEMGASAKGDIRYLCQFAEPDIALLTNAMPVHLLGFGDLNSIATTKGEIFESVSAGGVAIINRDSQYFSAWRKQAGRAELLSFSRENSQADFFSQDIVVTAAGFTHFKLCHHHRSVEILLPLLGRHNIDNALAAAAVSVAAGATLEQVKIGLEKVAAVAGRLKIIALPTATIIDDSYNASPGSVKAAIDVLAEFSGSRALVLGTMGELGEDALRLHVEVANYARDKKLEKMLVVGEYAEPMANAFGESAQSFDTLEQLVEDLSCLQGDAVILIKGSRSTHMERLVRALQLSGNVQGDVQENVQDNTQDNTQDNVRGNC